MTTDGFGMRDEDFAAAVVAQLGGRSVATAESCTAGRISQAFAAVGEAETRRSRRTPIASTVGLGWW